MGCQTGFYVLFDGVEQEKATSIIVDAFKFIAVFEGEMPGNSEVECGNCHNLSVEAARDAANAFLSRI